MSTFDSTQHPRTPAGVASGGQFSTAPRTEAAVTLARGQHTADCEAHAIGCAVENIRDAKKDRDPTIRNWAAGADPVEVGRGYLEDGSASCYCSSTDMTSARRRTDLGCLALQLHEARRLAVPGSGVDPDLAGEGIPLPEVSIYRSEMDGTLVVQVDTGGVDGRIRVNLNDGPVWDGDPETDEAPGAFMARPATSGAPLDRPMTRVEALAAAHDGFVTGTVAVDQEGLFAAIRDGSRAGADIDEHDLLVGLLVDGAIPYDSSYRVVGSASDGLLLVEVRTGLEGSDDGDDPSREQTEYESFLRDEARGKAREQFGQD